MTETTDGFEIAERDLRAARPGRFLRHPPGRRADVPADRSRARSRAARREHSAKRPAGFSRRHRTAGRLASSSGVGDRFRLIEIG